MTKIEFIKIKSASAINRFKKLSLTIKVLIFLIVITMSWFANLLFFGIATQTPDYQSATAEKGTLISTVTASGSVVSGNSAPITTSATGVIKEVYVGNGDSVRQGDTIATLLLDQSSLQKQAAAWASYLSAQNALNAAKSKMNSLQSALFAANQKFVHGAGTQNPITDDPTYIIQRADWLQAESDYTNQKGVIAAAEASVSSAWLSYAQTSATITAPIGGTISHLTLAPQIAIVGNSSTGVTGSTTTSSPSFGSINFEGGTPQAIVNLSEIDVTKAESGQKVTLTLEAFPDKTFTGKIITINTNGSLSSGVTTYPATITFDTGVDKMYPNMAVSATIITHIENDVVLVPSSAVQTTNGVSTVRVMKKNKVTMVEVEVGESNDTQTEIRSGVHDGDIVIIGSTTSQGSITQTTGNSPFGGAGFGAGRPRGGFGR